MRNIQVSTEVFARIWGHRIAGEESENDILTRLLSPRPSEARPKDQSSSAIPVSIRWRDDVRQALSELGGTAPLAAIYRKVREIRLAAGRGLPVNTDAIVRRELEQNCPISESFTKKRRWFMPAHSMGAGVWSLCDDG